eukprot:gnl/TRDRNA2_/TRDRNA2_135036_c0_seq1.p1 gnl/TRDRNA2_/TRDRNA2_135036_c0~~gnl/TRDRNA2_/TRDRNA2_135036_c0_seq1.p1  ORF type:complete len:337 (+),score=43.76 gnl/TRDRNA2_/TRDRNA2_135036_c0_seq1:149-1012(+)
MDEQPMMFLDERAAKIEVVVARTLDARAMFIDLIKEFKCPDEASSFGPDKNYWYSLRNAMVKDSDPDNVPVIAMNGDTPCAAAIYSETDGHRVKSRFTLWKIIVNAGDNCKGCAAAIVCSLIRNSRNLHGEFVPLAVDTWNKACDLELYIYFNSFDCLRRKPNTKVRCGNPNPARCEQFTNEVVTADHYFEGSRIPLYGSRPKRPHAVLDKNPRMDVRMKSRGSAVANPKRPTRAEWPVTTVSLNAETTSDAVSIPDATSAGIGFLLMFLCFRRGASAAVHESLLAS